MADAKAMMNRDDRITSSEVITYFIRLRPVMCQRQRKGAEFVWATQVLHGKDVTLGVEVQKTSHVKWERNCVKSVWWLSGLYWIGGYSHAGPAPEGSDWECNAYVYLHEPGPRPFGRPYPQCWADMTEVHDKDCLSMRVLLGSDWLSKMFALKVVNEDEQEMFEGRVFTVRFEEVRAYTSNGKKERRIVLLRGLEHLRPYLQSKHDCGLRWAGGVLYKLVGVRQRSTLKEYYKDLMKRSWPAAHAPVRPFPSPAVSAPVTPRVSIDGEMEEAAQILQAITAAPARAAVVPEEGPAETEERAEMEVDADAPETEEPHDDVHARTVADAVWPLQLHRIKRLLPTVPSPPEEEEVYISEDDRCPAAEAAMRTMNTFIVAAYHDGRIACSFVREHYSRYAALDDGFEQWCDDYARWLYPHLIRVVAEDSRAAFLELEQSLRDRCSIGPALDAFYSLTMEDVLGKLRLENA